MSPSRAGALALFAIGCAHTGLPATDGADALRELLDVAVERSVARLGREGGFEESPVTRIELPVAFAPLARALHGTGHGARVVTLESALNRAAERATAELGPWLRAEAGGFVSPDPDGVLAVAPDGATRAFEAVVERPLGERLHPLVERGLADAGAPEALERVREDARLLPLPRNADLDLPSFTSERVQTTFFVVLAEEEAGIRASRGDAPARLGRADRRTGSVAMGESR